MFFHVFSNWCGGIFSNLFHVCFSLRGFQSLGHHMFSRLVFDEQNSTFTWQQLAARPKQWKHPSSKSVSQTLTWFAVKETSFGDTDTSAVCGGVFLSSKTPSSQRIGSPIKTYVWHSRRKSLPMSRKRLITSDWHSVVYARDSFTSESAAECHLQSLPPSNRNHWLGSWDVT